MERPIGFSTGALHPISPVQAIETSLSLGARAIELSALRWDEIDLIAEAAAHPALDRFDWVSVHAPSRYRPSDERDVVEAMVGISRQRFPVIVHPDAIADPELWKELGDRLLLENMDRRKEVGRFADDFIELFRVLPKAGLCLDLAHLRQIDPSLVEGYRFLERFENRLRELHISEVASDSRHARLSLHAGGFLRDFSRLIPEPVPAIIESIVDPGHAEEELKAVRRFFEAGVPWPTEV